MYIFVFTTSVKQSSASFTKRWQESGGLECHCVYETELDFDFWKIISKDLQDAV